MIITQKVTLKDFLNSLFYIAISFPCLCINSSTDPLCKLDPVLNGSEILFTDSKQLQTQQFVNYAILLSVGINGYKLEELPY